MSSIHVTSSRRTACMRAHTATHMLHMLLAEIFPQTKQAGSYVGEDELRFDFFADRLLHKEELDNITQRINVLINEDYTVSTSEMNYQQAVASGAKAFFEDKYPEIVRVVRIHDTQSVELCGWTHVQTTSQIGSFLITEQTTVAAGVKRISAITWSQVALQALQYAHQQEAIATQLGVPLPQVHAKIDKIIWEYELERQQKHTMMSTYIQHKNRDAKDFWSHHIERVWNIEEDLILKPLVFNEIITCLKGISTFESRLVYTNSGQYALFHPQAKSISKWYSRAGGGSNSFFQGKDTTIVSFIEKL